MKSRLIIFFMFLPVLRTFAQVSEWEKVFRSSNNEYLQYTSIVRNYDVNHNVLVQYGRYTAEPIYPTVDSIRSSSSFLIQNTNTNDITHIVTLPVGYQVNDVRFVTLRKSDGVSTEDYCCFCGTRTQFDGIEYLPSSGGLSEFICLYSKHGFAGFFSMNDALNPSSSFTAKVRDVEKTKELFRMTCYSEQYGHYYTNQLSFIDNAVLDIIGLDDTVNAPSCFCRAKFYPDYYGTVRWDNNIRLNTYEIISDITETDNYVVTSSYNTIGDSLWIRYSEKEDHLVSGGLELNSSVGAIDFSSLSIYYDCNDPYYVSQFERIDDAKICHTIFDKIEMAYHYSGPYVGGLLNCQYDYNNGSMSFIQGATYKCEPNVKELVYMPSNKSTAILYRGDNNQDIVSIIKWTANNCMYPINQFFSNISNAQSLTLQERNGYEHLLWSGNEIGNPQSPMYLMNQRGEIGGGFGLTCHSKNTDKAQPATVNHVNKTKHMGIKYRFHYDSVSYPVLYIQFNPIDINKEIICNK